MEGACSMADRAPYRVEFRQAYQTRVLAPHLDAKPNNRSLDPFVSRLKHEGKTGEVLLIERATGTVVARQKVS